MMSVRRSDSRVEAHPARRAEQSIAAQRMGRSDFRTGAAAYSSPNHHAASAAAAWPAAPAGLPPAGRGIADWNGNEAACDTS